MSFSLDKIFRPASIAVIGASDRTDSVGYAVLKNLTAGGFPGAIYPVNRKHTHIQGLKAYLSVLDIPHDIDLAVVATPGETVPDLIKECGKKGIHGMVILSAGFKEAGEEGQKAFEAVAKLAQKHNIRIVGPNCVGIINPHEKLNASFATHMALPGKLAFISQSGALGTAILDWAAAQNVGFSHFVSIGSMVDVSFHDLIDYFGSDPHTSSILIYMETLTHARQFLSAARAFARSKPIIVLKAGKSPAGAKAALSHTGSMAGNDAVFDAAFQRAGILRVDTIAQLFNCAETLAKQPRPLGNRLGIVTNAGGPGILATDYLAAHGGQLAKLSESTYQKLNELLPSAWSHNNPVDVLGDVSAARYAEAAQAVLADENVDGLLALYVPVATSSPTEVAKMLLPLAHLSKKPVLTAWLGRQDVGEAREVFEQGGIPTYSFPESAVDVFLKMYQYDRNLQLLSETPVEFPEAFEPDRKRAKRLLETVATEGRLNFTEFEAKQLLACYNISIAPGGLATSAASAVEIATRIGFPVAMKISSPDILHKTEAGGVVLDVTDAEAAIAAFHQIFSAARNYNPNAHLHGVLVEKMLHKRYELIIGAKKDPIFGPAILFGMGGVMVELLKDRNIGLPPLNMTLAQRLIENTRAYQLLKGFRGLPAVDLEAMRFLLCKFAQLVVDFPEIGELDINPFGVDEQGGIALDARVVLDADCLAQKIAPHAHLCISPYPREYHKTVALKNGKFATLRSIRPEDESMEAELFSHFSEETQHFRFFGPFAHPTHKQLARFTQIDYDREVAIVAEMEDNGRKFIAAVVRLMVDSDNEAAEYVIVVADPWQGLGIGNLLTDYILDIARQRGIKKVYADMLKSNGKMVHMLQRRGFDIRFEDWDRSRAEATVMAE